MSHVNLAKVLQFSVFLRNVFGASQFLIYVDSDQPKEMVRFTKLSLLTPIVVFISNLVALAVGVLFLQQINTQSELPGMDMPMGSLTMIILQMSSLSALVAYFVTNYLTLVDREEYRNCQVSILELCKVLDRKYQQPYNTKGLAKRINFTLVVLPLYYAIYIFLFEGLFYNALDSYYLIPLAFMVQSLSASMTTVDLVSPMHILSDFCTMFAQVPVELMDEEFFSDFTAALDLFETITQNHGHREFFSIGNEFIVMISQSFYACFTLAQGSVNPATFYMALGGVLPRFLKIFYMARRGSILTESVSEIIFKNIKMDNVRCVEDLLLNIVLINVGLNNFNNFSLIFILLITHNKSFIEIKFYLFYAFYVFMFIKTVPLTYS